MELGDAIRHQNPEEIVKSRPDHCSEGTRLDRNSTARQ